MSEQITAMELQKENKRLREENARLKNSPTPEELDTASIANEAKNQRIRELEEALKHSLLMMEQTLEFRNSTGFVLGNVFLESTIERAKQLLQERTKRLEK